MRRKKGVVEIQFNWVFIIIAGVVILLFFVKMAGKFKQGSEDELAQDVIIRLSTIATSGQMSANSNTILDTPNIDLNLGCDAELCNEHGCYFEFDYGKRGVMTQNTAWMEIEPIFAPSNIKSDNLITWSLDWVVPYKTSNFLFMTYPEFKYVLVYDETDPQSEALSLQLYDKLTENDKLLLDDGPITLDEFSSYGYNGETEFKFVLFVDSIDLTYLPEDITRSPADAQIIFIDPSGSDINSGLVRYGVGGDTNGDGDIDTLQADAVENGLIYIGTPMLIGAVFSQDKEFYECNVVKSLYKLEKMNNLYHTKAKQLYDFYTANPDSRYCQNYYLPLLSTIEDFNSSLQATFEDRAVLDGQFVLKMEDIKDTNLVLQTKDCPHLY